MLVNNILYVKGVINILLISLRFAFYNRDGLSANAFQDVCVIHDSWQLDICQSCWRARRVSAAYVSACLPPPHPHVQHHHPHSSSHSPHHSLTLSPSQLFSLPSLLLILTHTALRLGTVNTHTITQLIKNTLIFCSYNYRVMCFYYSIDCLIRWHQSYVQLAGYQNQNDSRYVDCSDGVPPAPGTLCRFNMTTLGPCTAATSYGYPEGKPCILLKLNKV